MKHLCEKYIHLLIDLLGRGGIVKGGPQQLGVQKRIDIEVREGLELGSGLGDVKENMREKGKKIQQEEKCFSFSFDSKTPVRKKLTSQKK